MLNIQANSNVPYKLYHILGIQESDLAKTLFVYPLNTRATVTIKILEKEEPLNWRNDESVILLLKHFRLPNTTNFDSFRRYENILRLNNQDAKYYSNE